MIVCSYPFLKKKHERIRVVLMILEHPNKLTHLLICKVSINLKNRIFTIDKVTICGTSTFGSFVDEDLKN